MIATEDFKSLRERQKNIYQLGLLIDMFFKCIDFRKLLRLKPIEEWFENIFLKWISLQ